MRSLSSFAAAVVGLAGLSFQQSTYTNPVIWQDYPDIDVFRVGGVYYYSSSTFAFSPGAPVLKSYDLWRWTPVSHSVPNLDFANKYNLNGANDRAYVKGIWASTLRHRKSNDMFYWYGCVEGRTFAYTSANSGANANNGEVTSWNWKQAAIINKCYYDNGVMFDDNDKVYMTYGSTNIMVAEMSADGLSEVRSQQVYSGGSTYIEGARIFKIKGYYFITVVKVATGEWILRASNPFGPYTMRVLVDSINGPFGNGGRAHQGGFVEAVSGTWYYMAFMDAYPTGRIPVLAPLTWSSDGWPSLVKDSSGGWGVTYPVPTVTSKTVPSMMGVDTFSGPALSHEWEWNHNPDRSRFSFNNGLVLTAATVTDDLYNARNTLTRRIMGPKSVATYTFDISNMRDGDRAGAALFRDASAYIGIHQSGNTRSIVYFNNLRLGSNWATTNKGNVVATGPAVTGSTIYFRITADVTPAFGQQPVRQAQFAYSTNGQSWTQLGTHTLINDWTFFTGYRFAAFNYATKSLGGSVVLRRFAMEYPGSTTNPPTTGSPPPPTTPPPTTEPPPTTPPPTTPPPTTPPPTTPPPPSGCSALYGQCGGANYSGPKCCSQGTCKFSNDWYSQCL